MGESVCYSRTKGVFKGTWQIYLIAVLLVHSDCLFDIEGQLNTTFCQPYDSKQTPHSQSKALVYNLPWRRWLGIDFDEDWKECQQKIQNTLLGGY